MKACFLAAALVMAPAAAHAQMTYIEGNLGIAFTTDVQTEPFELDTGFGIFDGRVEGTFSPSFTFGAEAGLAGFGGDDGPFRFGISYTFADVGLEEARIVGELDGEPVDETVNKTELSAFGLPTQFNTQFALVNGYFNLPPWGQLGRAYVGAGIGAAFIEDLTTEFAIAGTVGARWAYGERGYIGAQYRLHYVSGPKDEVGARYDSMLFHTATIVLGVYFP